MINAVLAAAATDAPDDRDEDLDGLGDDEGDEEEADEDDFDEVEELAQGPTQDDWRYGKVWFEVLNPSHSPFPWPPHHWPSRQVHGCKVMSDHC